MDKLSDTSYNHSHQTLLAKLLAKEDITVTHGRFETAFFDVKNRTLGLPIWKDRGKDVYDMLVGHEVGHALYTPADSIEEYKKNYKGIPFDVFNIVEDIRIERLIQKTYPGLPKVFKKAYQVLVSEDFFKIGDQDIATMNFLNRLNLRGKVGTILEVPLSDYEETIYTKCLKAETYQDVLAICDEIIKYLDSIEEEKPKAQSNSNEDSSEEQSDEESVSSSGSNEEETEEPNQAERDMVNELMEQFEEALEDDGTESYSIESDTNEENEDDESSTVESETNDTGKYEASTLDSFKKSLQEDVAELSDNAIPMTMPSKLSVKKLINSNASIIEDRKSNELFMEIMDSHEFQDDYKKFKKDTKTKVGVLVREFERRKAAYQYSRATVSRSGTINVNKLHKYKYDDQIFSSVTNLADAKSHGMVFLIDYSGSMQYVLPDVIIQTLNLVHFCKTVNIPFDVYSFTTNHYSTSTDEDSIGPTEVDTSDNLVNHLLSSSMSKKDFEFGFQSLYGQAYTRKKECRGYGAIFNDLENMGGTPLDSTLLAFKHVLDNFNKKHNVQKLNLVVLTDGESSTTRTKNWNKNCGRNSISFKGKVYSLGNGYRDSTENVIKLLKDTTPNLTAIGMFLPEKPSYAVDHLGYGISRTAKNDYKKQYKKDGFLNFNGFKGYDNYTILPANVSIQDDREFHYEGADASNLANSKMAQNKLVNQFSKFNVSKKRSRIILTKFAEAIA